MSDNELLLDIAVFPYYGQIEVSDVIGRDLPQSYGQTTGAVFTEHTVDVFTMSVDQAVERDQNVRVRGGAVSIERAGPVRIQIFIKPPQDADEVNVLIRYDLQDCQ